MAINLLGAFFETVINVHNRLNGDPVHYHAPILPRQAVPTFRGPRSWEAEHLMFSVKNDLMARSAACHSMSYRSEG
jgi:hypothetical protein